MLFVMYFYPCKIILYNFPVVKTIAYSFYNKLKLSCCPAKILLRKHFKIKVIYIFYFIKSVYEPNCKSKTTHDIEENLHQLKFKEF